MLKNRDFKAVEVVGTAAYQAVATNAVFDWYNGRLMAYSATNGAVFNAVDVESNTLVFSHDLGDVTQVWTHAAAPDGKIYIAGLAKESVGELWVYKPEEKTIECLGVILPGHQAWSSTSDDEGNIYIGTFKEKDAHVVMYQASTGKMVDMGKVDSVDNSGYVRSMAYKDGQLYMGLGVKAKILRMDVKTKVATDITGNIAQLIGKDANDLKFTYDMGIAGDYLIVRVDADYKNALLFYNMKNGVWSDKVLKKQGTGHADDHGAWGFTQLPIHGDDTYVIYNGQLLAINYKTLETRETAIKYPSALRGGAVMLKDGKPMVLTLSQLTEVAYMDITAKTLEYKEPVMKASPLPIHNLAKGNNGKLYMTTYPGGPKGSEYDPKTNTFRMYNQGQSEGIIAGEGNTVYFGIYPGAIIQAMDTADGTIRPLFNLKDTYQQDRPYIMQYQNDLLLIGTIPDYQKLGGALAIYNPVGGEWKAWRNVVQDQSIVGLAYKDGLIYGSTTIRGGLDVNPTATEPKIFVWDVEKEEKIGEYSLNIPGLKTPMISGLIFDSKGRLWGAADGILFTWDTASNTVARYQNLYPEISGRGMWRPVRIKFGDDGLLYTDMAGRITVVDPDSEDWDHVTLPGGGVEVDFIELAYDAQGNQCLYFVDNSATTLKVVRVVDYA